MKHLLVPALALAALLSACSVGSSADRLSIVRSLPTLDGAALAVGPGKPYVVEFWATWCPPCVASVPHLVKVSEEHADEGLTIVGIHAPRGAEDEAAIRAFAKKMNVSYAIARDVDGAASRAYRVNGIPHAFVYDAAGNMIWDGHPMDPEFDGAVRRALTSAPQRAGAPGPG